MWLEVYLRQKQWEVIQGTGTVHTHVYMLEGSEDLIVIRSDASKSTTK